MVCHILVYLIDVSLHTDHNDFLRVISDKSIITMQAQRKDADKHLQKLLMLLQSIQLLLRFLQPFRTSQGQAVEQFDQTLLRTLLHSYFYTMPRVI